MEEIKPTTQNESVKEAPKASGSTENNDTPEPAGMLFDSIAYKEVADIPRFIDSMTINDSAMIILSTAAYAHKKGVLTLLESEVLSKAIRIYTAPRDGGGEITPDTMEKTEEKTD